MIYLERYGKNYKSHILSGQDTCCKMWSGGGIRNVYHYKLYKDEHVNPVCIICNAKSKACDTDNIDLQYFANKLTSSNPNRNKPARDLAINLCINHFNLLPNTKYSKIKKRVEKLDKSFKKHPLGSVVGYCVKTGLMDDVDLPDVDIKTVIKKASKKKKRVGHKDKKPTSDNFYMSGKWRSLRFKVLEKYGATCMLCNTGRKDGVVMHVDHIKPRSKYPELELDFSNLQVLCEDCNLGKSNLSEIDYRP